MTTSPHSHAGRRGGRLRAAVLAGLIVLAVVGCDASSDTGAGAAAGGGDAGPVKVGVITSTSGLVASYGQQFREGFEIGLDYATDGTGQAGGRELEVTYRDDASDPAKAAAEATDLIGQGYKILAGTVSSGVAAQLAPLADQNQILYVPGPAAADIITGINPYTFRSGRQTWQDVLTAQAFLGDVSGRKVMVLAQDYAFGEANVAAVTKVLGDAGGATVTPLLVPLDATEFTPFARQIVDGAPDLLFVAWAGDTSTALWQTLAQQGVLEATTVVTGLAERASFDVFGPAAEDLNFLAHYFAEAPDTPENDFLAAELGEKPPDLFHADGFVAAQMVVHAVEEGGEDVQAMIDALEGWTFAAPKGEQTIRAEDHAMLQPMFQARLTDQDGTLVPELVATLPPDQVAPPVAEG